MIGQSPQDFLIRYRMSKATSLLTSTSLSIGDISVQVDIQTSFIFPERSVTFTGCHQAISPTEQIIVLNHRQVTFLFTFLHDIAFSAKRIAFTPV